MSTPGPEGEETIVVHRERRLRNAQERLYPVPELGVHLHGPRLLATSGQGAMALRAVYAYSWGVEVEVKAVKRLWETQSGPNEFLQDYRVALALSKEDLVFHTVAGGQSPPWLVGGGSVDGQPGYDFAITSVLAFKPYPAMGTLWFGWSWESIGLEQDSLDIALPEPESFESAKILSDNTP